MFSKSEITLYVPYFNAGKTIGPCIESLKAQSIRPYEIIIVNDGSAEPLPVDFDCRVINHPVNKGLAAARNSALFASHTPLIASVDADVLVDSYWLEKLLQTLNSGTFSGVGGRMNEHYQEGLANQWRAVHMAQHWGNESIVNPPFLYGANTLFIKDHLLEVGAYDENLRTNNEDCTVSKGLYAASRQLCYEPAATCFHLRQDRLETILSGYWGWHHAKGLVAGDFDSSKGLLGRIGRVNFGISNYRFNLDKENKRPHFLFLDLLIPLVFCARDIDFFCKRNSLTVPDLSALVGIMSKDNKDCLRKFIPGDFCQHNGDHEWFAIYLEYFQESFKKFMMAERLNEVDLSRCLSENNYKTFEERSR